MSGSLSSAYREERFDRATSEPAGREPNLSSLIRADFAANPQNAKAKLLLFAFRIAHKLAALKHKQRLLWFASLPYLACYRVIFEWILGMELPARTRIGAGLKIMHGQALVVNYMARLGRHCTLRQCTTIGSKILPAGVPGPAPVIGDRVDIGCNVVILGAIHIGDDAVIGAGSIVVHDVPAGAVVAGNPARILKQRQQQNSDRL